MEKRSKKKRRTQNAEPEEAAFAQEVPTAAFAEELATAMESHVTAMFQNVYLQPSPEQEEDVTPMPRTPEVEAAGEPEAPSTGDNDPALGTRRCPKGKKPCKFWGYGDCRLGADCNWWHQKGTGGQNAAEHHSVVPCRYFFSQKGCVKGDCLRLRILE